tara:strand:+ start:2830 stop:3015 length:186 start_codon:yes stop_codon:yes gene_type:complete
MFVKKGERMNVLIENSHGTSIKKLIFFKFFLFKVKKIAVLLQNIAIVFFTVYLSVRQAVSH